MKMEGADQLIMGMRLVYTCTTFSVTDRCAYDILIMRMSLVLFQLLAFQSCIYSTMKAYYEHRGMSCRRQVVQFHSHSKENMQQLRSLREQFETVIAMMHEFLENGLQKRIRSRSMDHATVKVS